MPASILCCGEKDRERPSHLQGSLSKDETRSTGKPRIVIIEDEFFVAWNLQTLLRDMNFGHCEIASDAESGVNCAINQQAELLLVDVNLGGGPDGIEAVRRIQDIVKSRRSSLPPIQMKPI